MSRRRTRAEKRRITQRKKRIREREKRVKEVLTGKRRALVPQVKERKRVIVTTVPTKKDVGDLGPLKELGPDVILHVEFSRSAASLLSMQSKLPKEARLPKVLQVNSLRKMIKREIYRPLLMFTDLRIEAWTPADTTELMDSEKKSMRAPYSTPPDKLTANVNMVVNLGTPGVKYASIVTKMPLAWIKHPGGWHRNVSSRGGVVHQLYDPTAKENFYPFILVGARNKAKGLAIKFVYRKLAPIFARYPNLFPQPIKAAKQLFNWYNPNQIIL